MTDSSAIQQHIEYGRGKAAAYTGLKYDVYRLSSTSNGDFIASGNQIASGIWARRIQQRQFKGALETPVKPEMLLYQVIADLRNFTIGDVFIQDDPNFQAGFTSVNYATSEFNGFALASHEALEQVIGPRLNKNAQFYRQTAAVSVGSYTSSSAENALPLICTDGLYAFGAKGSTASKIPVGLTPLQNTYGDRDYSDVGGMPRKSAWRLYIPPMPFAAVNGQQATLREGDRVIMSDGAQYKVLVEYSQDVGVTGSELFLEREQTNI
jgi:hypothetical protein